jgi:hypothetical protein
MSSHPDEGPHGLEPGVPDWLLPGAPGHAGEGMVMEMLDHMAYDHEVLQAGQRALHLFANPVGHYSATLGRNKAREDTNMALPGCLPAPCALKVERLDIFFDTASLTMLELLDYGVLRLALGSKEYTDIRMAHVPSALFHEPMQGAGEQVAATLLAGKIHRDEAVAHILKRRRYVLTEGILIPPAQAIGCEFTVPGPLYRDVSIMVALGPRMARPVA